MTVGVVFIFISMILTGSELTLIVVDCRSKLVYNLRFPAHFLLVPNCTEWAEIIPYLLTTPKQNLKASYLPIKLISITTTMTGYLSLFSFCVALLHNLLNADWTWQTSACVPETDRNAPTLPLTGDHREESKLLRKENDGKQKIAKFQYKHWMLSAVRILLVVNPAMVGLAVSGPTPIMTS